MLRRILQACVATGAAAAMALALAAPAAAKPSPADERNKILASLKAKGGNLTTTAALPTCNHFTVISNIRFPSADGNPSCKLELYNYDNWGVVALQQWLLYCNNAPQITVDGDYGPTTRDVITWIQASKGITADGKYGPDTRSVLRWARFNGNTFIGCL